MNKEAVLAAIEILTKEDFYQSQYGIIFESMVHPQMFPETISAANPTGSRRKASSITTPLRKKPWNVIRS